MPFTVTFWAVAERQRPNNADNSIFFNIIVIDLFGSYIDLSNSEGKLCYFGFVV